MENLTSTVNNWISRNVGSLTTWIENYIDDVDIDDPDLRDINRWDVHGVADFIVNMLTDLAYDESGDGCVLDTSYTLEEAFRLGSHDGEWFYSQLCEFFWLDDEALSERDRKLEQEELSKAGGHGALLVGAL